MEGFLVHTCLTIHQRSFWLLAGMLERSHTQAGHPLPEVDFGGPRRKEMKNVMGVEGYGYIPDSQDPGKGG